MARGRSGRHFIIYTVTSLIVPCEYHIYSKQEIKLKIKCQPQLVWLSGLSASQQTERSLVRFPVRAHAWIVGQIPSWGRVKGN